MLMIPMMINADDNNDDNHDDDADDDSDNNIYSFSGDHSSIFASAFDLLRRITHYCMVN